MHQANDVTILHIQKAWVWRIFEEMGRYFFFFFFFTKGFGCVAGALSTWNDCGRGAQKSNCIERPFVPDYGVFFFFFLEKAMATHSITLACKIPWTEEPGRLQSMGSLRVGDDWVTSLSLFTFMQWRRKWQPTPVFLPGESQGWESLVGCHLWGHTESDTTEAT